MGFGCSVAVMGRSIIGSLFGYLVVNDGFGGRIRQLRQAEERVLTSAS